MSEDKSYEYTIYLCPVHDEPFCVKDGEDVVCPWCVIARALHMAPKPKVNMELDDLLIFINDYNEWVEKLTKGDWI